ncbi:hypothetical protein HY218_01420 [Candidatus Saccharibacteria bacterium]|nr:hypothetical protein [Candidatus Saccharibacteria bacterium]
MTDKQTSTKHLQITKATAVMVGVIAAASFITVFSLVASRALLSQRAYQSRVITGKEKAKKQLEKNLQITDSLVAQYKVFVGGTENVLGGNPSGSGDKDGDNARIVLDAIPSKYDFPALATSLEKLLTGYQIDAITGSDDEITQSANDKGFQDPRAIEIPFQFGITGSYQSALALLTTLEKSIRPIKIKILTISAQTDNSLHVSIDANTYYQPSKTLTIGTKEVK